MNTFYSSSDDFGDSHTPWPTGGRSHDYLSPVNNRSRSPLRGSSSYEWLYDKENESNLLNFVDFLSQEISQDNDSVALEPEIPLENAKLIGSGYTMEIFEGKWRDRPVAIKRIRRDAIPLREGGLALKDDSDYLDDRKAFYRKIREMRQEVLIMCREPLCNHRNIVKLLAVSWDEVSAQHGTAYFAPLLVVELANAAAPTLQTYYENQGIHKSSGDELNLIADIADGISALHMCGVVHGDLKPANILLFKDPEISTDLVAKVCDFGFADTNREHRGQTIYWAAPECRPKCPENVLINAGLAPFAADIFSFGLVAAYVALKGGEPLGVSESGEGDEDFINRLDHIKFCDETRRVVERNIQASVERGPGTITSHVQALIHQTLGCMPLDRIDSLESIRLQLTGKEGKRLNRFKIRPFQNTTLDVLRRGSVYATPKSPFNKKILDSLPPRIITELQRLSGAGKSLEQGEYTLHTRRRMVLEGAIHKKDELVSQMDFENMKISLDMIQRMRSTTGDWFDFLVSSVKMGTFVSDVETDLLALDGASRPAIFSLIDGNNILALRELLKKDPGQLHISLPTKDGWMPLHLAAALGRVEVIRLLVESFGANPNVRSKFSQHTPLHQAVSKTRIDSARILLQSGAQVDAKCYMQAPNRECSYMKTETVTPLQLAVSYRIGNQFPSKEGLDLIRLLLREAADYLTSLKGQPLLFLSLHDMELLKVFRDTIHDEDFRQLVHVLDDEKWTALHRAAMRLNYEAVRLLLDHGADPCARDAEGRTPYCLVKTAMSIDGSALWAQMEATKLLFQKQGSKKEDGKRIMDLFEQIGGAAIDVGDFTFSKEEVEAIHANFSSLPRFGGNYNPLTVFNARIQLMYYLQSRSQYLKMLTSYELEELPLVLCNSLSDWKFKRENGLISDKELPEHWESFFQEANREMGNLFTNFMEDNDAEEIVRILKDLLVAICKWIVDHNGIQVLPQIARIYQECVRIGADLEIEENVGIIWEMIMGRYANNFQFSVHQKRTMILLQSAKQIWRAITRGEVLDLLHELAVITNTESYIDNMISYCQIPLLRQGPQTPPEALENLSLYRKYPEATVFITTTSLLLPYTRISLFFLQLFIFLWPSFFFVTLCIDCRNLAYGRAFRSPCFTLLWSHLVPDTWGLFGKAFLLHPNIWRGIRAAKELILFTLWHWFPLRQPVILSTITDDPTTGISPRLDCMKKDALYPIYWLPLDHDGLACPVPCYSAIGELMRKWKNGQLPRNAWGDGWWEVDDGKWKRQDINMCPNWTAFTKASKDIKNFLLTSDPKRNDRPNLELYERFLSVRDYYLESPGQQLATMMELFSPYNLDCALRYQEIFVNKEVRTPEMINWKPPDWVQRWTAHFGLDQLRDKIKYTWDDGLLYSKKRREGSPESLLRSFMGYKR